MSLFWLEPAAPRALAWRLQAFGHLVFGAAPADLFQVAPAAAAAVVALAVGALVVQLAVQLEVFSPDVG